MTSSNSKEMVERYITHFATRLGYYAYLNAPRDKIVASELSSIYLQAGKFLFGHPSPKAFLSSDDDREGNVAVDLLA